jgi:hypothetical protein
VARPARQQFHAPFPADMMIPRDIATGVAPRSLPLDRRHRERSMRR